jgi:hypothetical protein
MKGWNEIIRQTMASTLLACSWFLVRRVQRSRGLTATWKTKWFLLNLIQLETHIYLFVFKQISYATKWNTNRADRGVRVRETGNEDGWINFESISASPQSLLTISFISGSVALVIETQMEVIHETNESSQRSVLCWFRLIFKFFMCHENVTVASRGMKRAGK